MTAQAYKQLENNKHEDNMRNEKNNKTITIYCQMDSHLHSH